MCTRPESDCQGWSTNWARGLQLDFATVRFLSSTGLGQLIALHHRVASQGGRLTLTRVNPLVYEVFAITRLVRQIDVQRDGDSEAA
jgi:anti-sigma B factor antagonist